MIITFYKYQGAGNDFVIIDNRKGEFPAQNHKLVKQLCDRKFGIGADGLMLLEHSVNHDFKMVYYNADGQPGSMCGNGGRCLVAFAKKLGLFDQKVQFEADSGVYHAELDGDEVKLKMNDVDHIDIFENHIFLDTGSPHHIEYVNQLKDYPVVETGRKIRYGAPYFQTGTNVNFLEQINENTFKIRTYERGVEDETLACGTGVTAAALASRATNRTTANTVYLNAEGGNLSVSFEYNNKGFENIVLKGPATFVYQGQIEW